MSGFDPEQSSGASHEPQGSLTYRTATPDDAYSLMLLERQAIAHRRGQEPPATPLQRPEGGWWVEEHLEQPDTWSRLAFDQGQLVGHILGYPTEEAPGGDAAFLPLQHIAALMVRPDRWRAGIGSDLLNWAVATLPDLGATAVDLWVDGDNERAKTLYDRAGFRPTTGARFHPQQGNLQFHYLLEL